MNGVDDFNDLNTWLRPTLQFFGFVLVAILITLVFLVVELRHRRSYRRHHHSRRSDGVNRSDMEYRSPTCIRERRRYSGGNFTYRAERHR